MDIFLKFVYAWKVTAWVYSSFVEVLRRFYRTNFLFAWFSNQRDALPLQLPLERCRKLLSTGFPFQKVLIYFFISLQIVLIANHEVTAYEVTAYVLRLG